MFRGLDCLYKMSVIVTYKNDSLIEVNEINYQVLKKQMLNLRRKPLMSIKVLVERKLKLISKALKISFFKFDYHLSQLDSIHIKAKPWMKVHHLDLVKMISLLNNLKYVEYDTAYKHEYFFPFLYFAMKCKQGEKININFFKMGLGDVKTKDRARTAYLISLIGRECYNVCNMKIDSYMRKSCFHYFATSLDIMNRSKERKKGLFMGQALTAALPREYNRYIKLLPPLAYMSYPIGSKKKYLRDAQTLTKF